jgi:hypothetical protein
MKALIKRWIGFLIELYAVKRVPSSVQAASADASDSNSWSSLSPRDWTMIWRSILLLSYDKYFCQVFGKEKIILESLAQNANAAWVDSLPIFDKCWDCNEPLTALPAGKQCSSCRVIYTEKGDWKRCSYCFVPPPALGFGQSVKNVRKLNGEILNGHCGILNGHCGSCGWNYRILTTSRALMAIPFYFNGKPVPADPDPLYKANVHIDVPESLSDPKHFGHLMWKFCDFMASREGTK